MKRSNCLAFALAAWWRWRDRGAYWAVRKTRHLVGWHWLVHYRGRWIAFEPMTYYGTWWREAVAKIWYEGRIVRGDEPKGAAMPKQDGYTVTIEFKITPPDGGEHFSEVKTYPRMTKEQVAEFQADLLEAQLAMHRKWARAG